MREEIAKYTNKEVEVIPFGVDVNRFVPVKVKHEKSQIVIGNIKTLEPAYGNKYLLEAFVSIVKKYPQYELCLLLVGDGSQRSELEILAINNGIGHLVTFTGKVPHSEIEKYHQQIDIFVSLTTVDESFGVSLVEAMACETAVIASATPGFMEVIAADAFGTIVKRNSAEEATKAILYYLENPEVRSNIGKAARQRVLEKYDWKKNLNQMMLVYNKFVSKQ